MELKHTKAFMEEKIAENRFDTYAIVVGKGGNEGAITSANADLDTYFDIASLGKILVTSPLILKAVGKGLLHLEDTLDMFFPDVPADKRKITIFQMMTHTSGIHENIIPSFTCDRGKNAVVRYILAQPLDFLPGSKFQYSSQGMILLGYIIEHVYNMPLDGAYYAYLAAPLGLTRVRFNIDIEEDNAAVCYYRPAAGKNRAADRNVYNMKNCVSGSGGAFMSAGTMQKYALAVMKKDERIYPKELFDLAEQDKTPDKSDGRGLGYAYVDGRHPSMGTLFPNGSFGHHGDTGVSVYFNRPDDLYAIVLTNVKRFENLVCNHSTNNKDAVWELRGQIHDEIKKDLVEQHLL